MRKKLLVYDCEIAKCIPTQYEPIEPALEYCEGWRDFEGMGISVIGCWTSWDDATQIFNYLTLDKFQSLIDQADEIVGFNSISFDDQLMKVYGVNITTTYDLLQEIWVAAGLPRTYTYGVTVPGYSLGAMAEANYGTAKLGNGADAPKLWQRGQLLPLVNYLLKDISLTCRLYFDRGHLVDPTDGKILMLRP